VFSEKLPLKYELLTDITPLSRTIVVRNPLEEDENIIPFCDIEMLKGKVVRIFTVPITVNELSGQPIGIKCPTGTT
jgi:hypothetical protein